MLREADTVGVFQVESRAQMATLPRTRRSASTTWWSRWRSSAPARSSARWSTPTSSAARGREPVDLPAPALEPILKRTLGRAALPGAAPAIAMTVAGFTGGEAEELRRAMGFKRSRGAHEGDRGAAARGHGASAASPARRRSRSSTRSPRSRSTASPSRTRRASPSSPTRAPTSRPTTRRPSTSALLNNQPMGFYHPATLVKDAQRHGVEVRPIDVQRSAGGAGWEAGRVGARRHPPRPALRAGLGRRPLRVEGSRPPAPSPTSRS